MESRAVVGWIVLVVVLDGAAPLIGGLLPDAKLRRWRPAMFGFAAGTLLVSGAADVLPEAVDRVGPVALALGLGAFTLLGLVERVTSRRRRHEERPVSPIALLGSDALHNFGDGLAIAAAFLVSPHLGLYTSFAVIMHELPEELADYALLRTAGMSKRGALASLALVQLTSALGAASALVASRGLAGIEGSMLAVAAGMFLYIGAIDLLPEVVRAKRHSAWMAFGVGAALAALG
jgi:zinc and cadmium transporter